MSSSDRQFRVGFSRDFLDEHSSLVFPDIGLSLLDAAPGLSHEFLAEYHAEYVPEQLRDFDVVISLKPRVSAASLEGVERLHWRPHSIHLTNKRMSLGVSTVENTHEYLYGRRRHADFQPGKVSHVWNF